MPPTMLLLQRRNAVSEKRLSPLILLGMCCRVCSQSRFVS
jgi:hypothetical protein